MLGWFIVVIDESGSSNSGLNSFVNLEKKVFLGNVVDTPIKASESTE